MRKVRAVIGIAAITGVVVGVGKEYKKELRQVKRHKIASDFRFGLKGKELAEGLKFVVDNHQFYVSEAVNAGTNALHYKLQVVSLSHLEDPAHPDHVIILNYYPAPQGGKDMLSWPPHRSRKGVDLF